MQALISYKKGHQYPPQAMVQNPMGQEKVHYHVKLS